LARSRASGGGAVYLDLGIVSSSGFGQQGSNPGDDHVHGDGVQAAFGDDHVGVALGRFDELQVHRTHRHLILLDDRGDRPPALLDVALQPADEAHVGIGIDEDLDVEQFAQAPLGEDQNALHQDHQLRFDVARQVGAGVGGEIVDRDLDRLPPAQRFQMVDQQLGLERVGVVEVDDVALRPRQLPQVPVVSIVGQQDDAPGPDPIEDDVGDGRFPGTGATGDPEDDRRYAGGHGAIIRAGSDQWTVDSDQ